jgi:hypothetical protein
MRQLYWLCRKVLVIARMRSGRGLIHSSLNDTVPSPRAAGGRELRLLAMDALKSAGSGQSALELAGAHEGASIGFFQTSPISN